MKKIKMKIKFIQEDAIRNVVLIRRCSNDRSECSPNIIMTLNNYKLLNIRFYHNHFYMQHYKNLLKDNKAKQIILSNRVESIQNILFNKLEKHKTKYYKNITSILRRKPY